MIVNQIPAVTEARTAEGLSVDITAPSDDPFGLATIKRIDCAHSGQEAPTPPAPKRTLNLQCAVTAYRLWYTAVSIEGIFHAGRAGGIEDNKAMSIAAIRPCHVDFTLNSDTPYGWATLAPGAP